MSPDQAINLLVQAGIGVLALIILSQYMKDNGKVLSSLVGFIGDNNTQTNLLRQSFDKNNSQVDALKASVDSSPEKIAALVVQRQEPVVKQVQADHEAIRSDNKTAAQKLDQAQTGIDKLQTVPDLIKGLTDEVHQLSDEFKTYLKASDQVQSLEKAVVDQGKILSERFGAVEQKLGELVMKIPAPAINTVPVAQPATVAEGASA